MFWRKLLNYFGYRPVPTLICMRQVDTWRWPDHLGEKTEGKCIKCGVLIYFEEQNERFRKICHICAGY